MFDAKLCNLKLSTRVQLSQNGKHLITFSFASIVKLNASVATLYSVVHITISVSVYSNERD